MTMIVRRASADLTSARQRGLARSCRLVFMRPRRLLVKVHRWLSFVLLAWLVVVSVSGGWLAVDDSVSSWFNGDRYRASTGDVGPDAAMAAAADALPDEAELYGVTLPVNGRGVYQVGAELHLETEQPIPEGVEPPHRYFNVFVDPGSGQVNEVVDTEAGPSWWLYRGHIYLWQDHGVFGVFHPVDGWCRLNAEGIEPGGAKGVVCDVLPDGMDLVAWLGLGWIVVLLTGFYLWYWPGVRRWATAFVVRRDRGPFALNMSLHKVIGFVVWVPLLVVAFTGVAFAFPNMKSWYENATPAQRDFYLWTPSDEALVSEEADGREPIGADAALQVMQETFPDRTIQNMATPFDETATYTAWVSRGFDPWTAEGGAGNTWVSVDQYSGAVLYDGSPEEGNVYDQAWQDWSFPLHTGDFLATPSRVLWSILAMTPLVLGGTGLIMNRIRAAKRARRVSSLSATKPSVETVDETRGADKVDEVDKVDKVDETDKEAETADEVEVAEPSTVGA
jgi:uncharacterized iron-regulated membrane protein